MTLSLSSVLNCNLFILAAAAILSFLYRDWQYLSANLAFLSACVLMCILRLVFPFELGFAESIYIQVPSAVVDFIYGVHTAAGFEFTFIELLLLIWAVGILWGLCRRLRGFFSFRRLKRFACPADSEALRLALFRLGDKDIGKFEICRIPVDTVPFYTGIFRPKIFLPDACFSEDEFYYILRHELEHYHHHDLMIRAAAELASIIYWWNPLILCLKRRLFSILEVRADRYATGGFSGEQAASYAECLVSCARRNMSAVPVIQSGMTSDNSVILRQRISILLRAEDFVGWKHIRLFFLSAMLVIIMFFSCSVIFEPTTAFPEEFREEGIFSLDFDDVYAIAAGDGYIIYVNGAEYAYTENPPAEIIEQIPTYDSETEAMQ